MGKLRGAAVLPSSHESALRLHSGPPARIAQPTHKGMAHTGNVRATQHARNESQTLTFTRITE